MRENGFWKVCEALDCDQRIELLRHLFELETSGFQCVNELAEWMHLSRATTSIHLKKLAMAGLITSKQSDRRVYYRAFAATKIGERVNATIRTFLESGPNDERLYRFRKYVHALSLSRRAAIVRCLHSKPRLSLKELASRTNMPPHTVDRLLEDLDRARIVDMNGVVVSPGVDPELTLLELTLAR